MQDQQKSQIVSGLFFEFHSLENQGLIVDRVGADAGDVSQIQLAHLHVIGSIGLRLPVHDSGSSHGVQDDRRGRVVSADVVICNISSKAVSISRTVIIFF